MTKRAFILAIERYSQLEEGLSPELPGTHESALEFREWLIGTKRLDPSDIFFCAEDLSLEGRTSGASRNEVVNELLRLKDNGKDDTEESFFFFSGHAFNYTDIDGNPVADVLVAADYKKRQISGPACLMLNEVQVYLSRHLGPGSHYYFIDGCRNDITTGEIRVPVLELTFEDPSRLGDPDVYTLFSTATGYTAAVGSGFAMHLLEGLKGRGKAKTWYSRPDKMAVVFETLRRYIRDKISPQRVSQRVQADGEGMILEITPPPRYSCRVTVQNAQPDDRFHVEVRNRMGYLVDSFDFSGPTHSFSQVPDEYHLVVTHPTSPLVPVPVDQPPADLYDDCELRFEMSPVPVPAPPPQPGIITVVAPEGTMSTVRSLELGEKERGEGEFTIELPAGQYVVETSDPSGVKIKHQDVTLSADEHVIADMARFDRSPLRDSLLDAIPGDHRDGLAFFSEGLGPIADQDLSLWLALIGSSRIIGSENEFSRLGRLPLRSFSQEEPGSAPIYVLAGFDDPEITFETGVSRDDAPNWERSASVAGIPGLHETVFPTKPEQYLLSLRLDRHAPLTIATRCLANRATLVTVTRDENDEIVVQQFILPIAHLTRYLPPTVNRYLHLYDIKRIAQANRLFASGRSVSTVFHEGELVDALYGKWLEPLMAIMASYELIRRGHADQLRTAIENLRKFFSDIPDVEALAKLSGAGWEWPSQPPLFQYGLLAIPNYQELLPLPADHLEFRGPWTAWRNAVRTTGQD